MSFHQPASLTAMLIAAATALVTPATPIKIFSKDEPAAAKPARVDQYGDPVPDGCLARIGTVRFRDGGPSHGLGQPSLHFLPDGKRLISVGHESVRMWDVETGQEIRCFHKNEAAVLGYGGCAVSKDGSRLAVLINGEKSVLQLWDVATGREMGAIELGKAYVAVAGLSADAAVLVAPEENSLCLWDLATLQKTITIPTDQKPTKAAISRDCKTLAWAAGDAEVRVVEIASGNVRHKLSVSGKECSELQFSPDDKLLLVGARNLFGGDVELWDVATGKVLPQPRPRGVQAAAFSADGKWLATSNEASNSVLLWNLATKLRETVITLDGGFTGKSVGVAFSPDSRTLATAGAAIQLWDIETKKEIRSRGENCSAVEYMVFSPDGGTLVTRKERIGACIWNAATGQLRAKASDDIGSTDFVFSPDGKHLAGSDKTFNRPGLALWDSKTGKPLNGWAKPASDSYVSFENFPTAYAPDGMSITTLSQSGTLDTWRTGDGKLLGELGLGLKKGTNSLCVALLSPDARYFGLALQDLDKRSGVLRLWNVATGKEMPQIDLSTRPYRRMSFSPDGRYIVGSSIQPQVSLWDVAKGKVIRQFNEPSDDLEPKSGFSPDGKTLALGGKGMYTLFEIATGKERARRDDLAGHVEYLVFAPDGRRLATSLSDTTVMIWDATSHSAAMNAGPSKEELEDLWTTLAGDDAAKAYRAIWRLVTIPDQAVAMLSPRLKPAASVDEKRWQQIVRDLNSDQFAVRTEASKQLHELGDVALPLIRKALKEPVTLELRRRLEAVQSKWEGPLAAGDALRTLRAIEALEQIGTANAKEVLSKLADGATEAMVTHEAKASLERLGRRTSH